MNSGLQEIIARVELIMYIDYSSSSVFVCKLATPKGVFSLAHMTALGTFVIIGCNNFASSYLYVYFVL